MGTGCDTMKQAATDMYHWIFPPEIDVPDCVRKMLERIYPTIDWDSVTFHKGMPWIFRLGSQDGLTLPDTYGMHDMEIYVLESDWNVCTCDGLALPVHEGFHVLQCRDMVGGWGIGFFRLFVVAYLSSVLKGGADNPIEKPAYDQAEDDAVAMGLSPLFNTCCNYVANTGKKICDCSTSPPSFDQSALDDLISHCPDIVKTSSGINFWDVIVESTPGAKWLVNKARELIRENCTFRLDEKASQEEPAAAGGAFWKAAGRFLLMCSSSLFEAGLLWLIAAIWSVIWGLFWAIVTLVIAILKPILEAVLLIVDGILWIVTGIVCAAEWLWNKFTGAMRAVCNWATDLEKTCSEWRETREKKCAREEDQGYEECAREEDHGYSECSRTEDQGYEDCCDWWPCSWACDAWVWVSNIVCVAWTWVSNVVCVAWTWVSHIVCVAWTWIVSRTCAAFTYVVRGITCWAK